MNYETMDWDAEAKRIRAAFNLKDECMFVGGHFKDDAYRLVTHSHKEWMNLMGDSQLLVNYHATHTKKKTTLFERRFYVGNPTTHAFARLHHQEKLSVFRPHPQYSLQLARGIFHLDLLTPEIEAALQVTISNHQKLEWTLEYEERLK